MSSMAGCSIVTIQPLDRDIHIEESNIAYGSRWQTMLNSSVHDIDVGSDDNGIFPSSYVNGFYIVVILKKDSNFCTTQDWKLRKYGQDGSKSSSEEYKLSRNTSYLNEKTIFVEITELENPTVYITLIVIGLYVTLLVVTLFLGKMCNRFNSFKSTSITHPIVGTVYITFDEIYLIFGKLQELFGVDSDTDDMKRRRTNRKSVVQLEDTDCICIDIIHVNKNDKLQEKSNPNSQHVSDSEGKEPQLNSKKEEKDSHGYTHQDLENGTKEPNEITIEETNKISSGERDDTNKISRSNIEKVKRALNIAEEDDVRIVSTVRQKKLSQKRRNCEPKLSNMATICDTTLFPDARRMRSKLYSWIMVLVGIFYVIPALQLMLAAQNITFGTGSGDVCYYNYLCRYRTYGFTGLWFEDYGHVFSNISYVFCGIHFIVLVRVRQGERRKAMIKVYQLNTSEAKAVEQVEREMDATTIPIKGLFTQFSQIAKRLVKKDEPKEELPEKLNQRNVEFLNRCGIPEQYGLFYTMGGALILEGILSACYHICPVNESFQFDTTFMYIMTILMFLKVYQFRHPDLTARAYTIFIMIAITLIFEAIGYYWRSTPGVFMSIFILTYMMFTVVFMNAMFFQGDKEKRKKARAIKENKEGPQVLFAVMMMANLALAIFFLVSSLNEDSVVSNYLLIIFGANMTLYVMYYVVVKNYHVYRLRRKQESLGYSCCIYFLLGSICGLIGVYFFVVQEKDTLRSPAESRLLNAECTFWFFDKHDIWHFASAFGLLFIFLALLTIEDNNTATSWDEIPVF
jgi:hypothetical protein